MVVRNSPRRSDRALNIVPESLGSRHRCATRQDVLSPRRSSSSSPSRTVSRPWNFRSELSPWNVRPMQEGPCAGCDRSENWDGRRRFDAYDPGDVMWRSKARCVRIWRRGNMEKGGMIPTLRGDGRGRAGRRSASRAVGEPDAGFTGGIARRSDRDGAKG